MKIKTLVSALLFFSAVPLIAQDGKAIFNKQCKACHHIGNGIKIGPDLKGIAEKRSFDWLAKFIVNSKELIASGDKDAVSVFEEFGQKPMPSTKLSMAEISAVLAFIKNGGESGPGASEQKTAELLSFTPSIETGRDLFTGSLAFTNGGASCISCHSIKDNHVFAGGSFAKDLSVSHNDEIVESMIASIPAMISSYKDYELTIAEKKHLEAFMKDVKANQLYYTASQSGSFLFLGGFGVFVIVFLVANIFWKQAKKHCVKCDIYDRQESSI